MNLYGWRKPRQQRRVAVDAPLGVIAKINDRYRRWLDRWSLVTTKPENLEGALSGEQALTGVEFFIGATVLGFIFAGSVMAAAYAIFIPNELSKQLTTRGPEIVESTSILFFGYTLGQIALLAFAGVSSSLVIRRFETDVSMSRIVDRWLHLCNLDCILFLLFSVNLCGRAITDAHYGGPPSRMYEEATWYIAIAIGAALTIYYCLQAVRIDRALSKQHVLAFLLSYVIGIVLLGVIRIFVLATMCSLIWDIG